MQHCGSCSSGSQGDSSDRQISSCRRGRYQVRVPYVCLSFGSFQASASEMHVRPRQLAGPRLRSLTPWSHTRSSEASHLCPTPRMICLTLHHSTTASRPRNSAQTRSLADESDAADVPSPFLRASEQLEPASSQSTPLYIAL